MIIKIILLFQTIKYLKLSQIFWQITYKLKSKKNLKINSSDFNFKEANFLKVLLPCRKYNGSLSFVFLNFQESFSNEVNWNEDKYGKLWTYNLEYFDYLTQEDISITERLKLLRSFYSFSVDKKRTLEPYPVSLRIINSIKFFSTNKIQDKDILKYVYQELNFLSKNLEYHILGNHLLENGFALLLGGATFSNKKWETKAKFILQKELKEQILSDGAHFELSPMYHQIILYRVLELIDWYTVYESKDIEFLNFLKNKATLMCSWIKNVSFENGDLPLFNDAANNITYTTNELLSYANILNIDKIDANLGESGYRSFINETYEVKMDYAQIGPSYQPGHAHADALSFLMYYEKKQLFVEAGTSTYQIGKQRSFERSTRAHNTVVVDDQNQSEVWSGFRVGNRAITKILVDTEFHLKAQHDGYKKKAGLCFREFKFEKKIVHITDTLEKNVTGIAYFHLANTIEIDDLKRNTVFLKNGVKMEFSDACMVSIEDFTYATEYNKYLHSKTIKVEFKQLLQTKIVLQ